MAERNEKEAEQEKTKAMAEEIEALRKQLQGMLSLNNILLSNSFLLVKFYLKLKLNFRDRIFSRRILLTLSSSGYCAAPAKFYW